MTERKSLFDRVLKVDPTLQEVLLKQRHRLDVGDYERVEDVLKNEDSCHREWRKAIFRLFDAKLFELELDPERYHEDDRRLNAKLSPVCISLLNSRCAELIVT